MLLIASGLTGYDIEATDGVIGTVSDFLFDDTSCSFIPQQSAQSAVTTAP
jgi:hypothetical protein